jgi:hypothetical protein
MQDEVSFQPAFQTGIERGGSDRIWRGLTMLRLAMSPIFRDAKAIIEQRPCIVTARAAPSFVAPPP